MRVLNFGSDYVAQRETMLNKAEKPVETKKEDVENKVQAGGGENSGTEEKRNTVDDATVCPPNKKTEKEKAQNKAPFNKNKV